MKSSKTKLFVLIVNAVFVFALIAIYIVSIVKVESIRPQKSMIFKDFNELEDVLDTFNKKETVTISEYDKPKNLSYSKNINYIFDVDGKKVYFSAFEFDSPEDAQKYFCQITGNHYTSNFRNILKYQSVKHYLIINSGIRVVLYDNYLYFIKSNNIKAFYMTINALNEKFSVFMDVYP